jgi:hypothetical protein
MVKELDLENTEVEKLKPVYFHVFFFITESNTTGDKSNRRG